MTLGQLDSLPGYVSTIREKNGTKGQEVAHLLGGVPLTGRFTLAYNGLCVTVPEALIDTGANGFIFINHQLANQLVKRLGAEVRGIDPHPVGGFEGRVTQRLTQKVRAHIRVQGVGFNDQWMLVARMKQPMIVGRKWLDYHDIWVDCRRRRLLPPPTMPRTFLTREICVDETKAVVDPNAEADVQKREKAMAEEDARRRNGRTNASIIPLRVSKSPQLTTEVLATIEPQSPAWRPLRIEQRSEKPWQQVRFTDESDIPLPKPEALPTTPGTRIPYPPFRMERDAHRPAKPLDLAFINTYPLMKMARKAPAAGVTSLFEIDCLIQVEKERAKAGKDGLGDDSAELQKLVDKMLPPEYRKYHDVFSKAKSDKLPPYRPATDHKIDLTDDARPEDLGYSPLYKLSLEELEVSRQYIIDNLEKGFIDASQAPWAAPILFVKKKDGALRFCVDYRKLNAMTRKNRYPLPLIEETLARISGAKIFTKIDIRQAFNRIRMHPDDEELTTFRTRYGTYKYKVLPFGLTNGPATFQRYINDTLMGYLDDFCSAYLDDILIYSDDLESHRVHVEKVLQRLREAGLPADIRKCEFHVTETKFLGFVISVNGIAVDPDKVAVVKDWTEPATVKGIQSFLGFCNFYRKFVRNYGRIAKPLNNLTRKGEAFQWTVACQLAFDELKARLLSAPILRHFSYADDVETRMETDSSDGVIAGVLTQRNPAEGPDWHPVAFYSETMHGAEHNYPIHDKELMAVVRGLQCWRSELIGLPTPFLVITDNQALEYFSKKRLLNMRQAGWSEIMAQYHFEITYRPGKENVLADALSRKAEDVRTQKDRKEIQRTIRIFRPVRELDSSDGMLSELNLGTRADSVAIIAAIDDLTTVDEHPIMLTDEILTANKSDSTLEPYREKAQSSQTDSEFSMLHDKYLLHCGRLVVPENPDNLRTRILAEFHNRIVAAHPGRNKMRALVKAQYWWSGMAADIDRFVANCATCRSAKVPRDKTPGLLQPLPVTDQPWRDLVMDFKSMPKDRKGYNNLMVIIDRLCKACWTIPCKDDITAPIAAMLYYKGPYRVFGLPRSMVTDRGPQFVSQFQQEMSTILGINWKLATSGHHQTAGQAEIMNQYIDQRLRPYINHYQDNWSDMMPALDAVQISLPHDSLDGLSPHEVLLGYPMPMHIDWASRTTDWSEYSAKDRLSRKDAQKHIETLKGYVEAAREAISQTQGRMVARENRSRRAPDFDIKDRVFVVKKGWSTTRPSDKLDFPLTRLSYEIIGKVKDNVFKLKVPPSWRATDQFNADRLRKFPGNPLPGQANENPAGEDVSGEEEWEVAKVTASRIHYNKLQYQAEWRGWDPDPTWYPASDFKNAVTKIREFHDEHPDQAGPPTRLAQWERAALAEESDPPHKDDNKPAASSTTGTRARTRRSS
jgi:predicted aspartyl protease